MLKKNYKKIFFLLFLVFITYANSLTGDFLSDDITSIKENPDIGNFSFSILEKFPFFSLLNFTLYSVHLLFGLTPFFYHLINVLFHAGSTILIFLITGLFFLPPVNFFAAGIFAVHPLLTEGVTWISALPYTLSAVFVLLSFFFYSQKSSAYLTTKNLKSLIASFLFFFLAWNTNEKAVVFPLILFLYEFCFGDLKKNWPRLLPFLLLALIWALSFFIKIGPTVSSAQGFYTYSEKTVNNPFLQIPIAINSYLSLFFWPKDLSFYHTELSFTQTEFLIRFIVFIIFIIFTIFSFLKSRKVFFWLSFFLVALSPTLNPLGIGWVVAERYAYLPSLGLIIIAALVINKIGQILKNQKLSYLIFFIVIFLLSGRTIVRNFDFQNQDNLWLATAKTAPSSAQNHNNLGDLYGRRKDLEKSIFHFKKAIELQPNYGDAYHNLANTYSQVGKIDLAKENYQKAIATNPYLWQSYQNLAGLYFNEANFKQAAGNLEEAVKVNPQNPNLYANLGVIYLKLGETAKAQEFLEMAMRLDPNNLSLKTAIEEILKEAINENK